MSIDGQDQLNKRRIQDILREREDEKKNRKNDKKRKKAD